MKRKRKKKGKEKCEKKRGIKCGGESSQLISKIPRLSLLN
jgi:hypothetical protein